MTEQFDENKFKLWIEYEKIAMHFNGLLIQLRIRALAGVGAITTLASFFIADENGVINWGIIAFVSLGLLVAWFAIFVIDYLYYHRLLQGAVNSITKLEKSTINQNVPIDMSTQIEEAAGGSKSASPWNKAILAFYLIVMCLLLAIVFYALHKQNIHIPCACAH